MIQNSKKIIVSLISAVVIILLLFLVKDTWRGYVIESLGGYTKKEQTVIVDTLPSIIDTIYLPSKTEYVEVPILIPDIIIKDTIIYKNKEGDNITSIRDSTLTYVNLFEDSLIKGNITTKIDLFDCTMIKQDFNYNRKDTFKIIERIPIKERIETVVEKDNRNKLGVGVSANNLGAIGVGGVYQLKNNLQIQLNYGILGGNNKIQVGNNTYDKVITIGVYKLF